MPRPVYSGQATSLSDSNERITRSVRGEGRTDVVALVNPSGGARTAYVVIYVPESARFADSSYRLEFVRQRRS